jgi:hypothetical protein
MRINAIGALTGALAALLTMACGDGPGQDARTATTASELGSKGSGVQNDHVRSGAIIPRLPANPTLMANTVPKNGDVNPYGVAFVPPGFPRGGLLDADDIIVSNFNNIKNRQGTGTTIVRIEQKVEQPKTATVFFRDDDVMGLSTALGVLERGFVLVGNVPSTDGSGVCTPGPNGEMLNVGQGALRIIDRDGEVVRTLTSETLLDGPWDLTVVDRGSRALVFVSNVLSGTVTRLELSIDDDDRDDRGNAQIEVESATQIASGYMHRCDMAAFVLGPTGVALDPDRDVLYVASAADNAIFAVDDASDTRHDHGTGRQVVTDMMHLHGPLGLVRAQNGNLLSAQGDAVNPDPNQPSEIVEFTAKGKFVDQVSVDPGTGGAFGLALEERSNGFRLAAVDDNVNMLDIWIVP